MSIIPEGTTHEYSQPTTARWRNLSGETWSWWGGKGWIHTTEDSLQFAERNADRLTPVKAGWSGEGLPPVGMVCEHKDYGGVTILAYGLFRGQQVVIAQANDTVVAATQDFYFPIRTPGQIAKIERSKACNEMFGVMTSVEREGNRSDMAEALYDAGYRKQVTA